MDYYDLGTHTRNVTTSSPGTQLWFDRGLKSRSKRHVTALGKPPHKVHGVAVMRINPCQRYALEAEPMATPLLEG